MLPLVPPEEFIQTRGLKASPWLICLGTFCGRWEMRALCRASGRKGF